MASNFKSKHADAVTHALNVTQAPDRQLTLLDVGIGRSAIDGGQTATASRLEFEVIPGPRIVSVA
jgi:hypothetical protein